MVRSFPRETSALAALVQYVRDFLAAEGLPDGAGFDLDLVLEELFTNLVKYGRGARGAVDVGLDRVPDGVRITLIEYDAEPFDPTASPSVDVKRPIAERRPGGLGIHFVRTLSKDFRYDYRDRTGTITVLMKERA